MAPKGAMRLKAVASSQNPVLGKLETGWTLGCLTTGSVPQGNSSYLVREVLLLGRLRYLLHQVLQPLLRGMRHITHHVWVQLRDAMFLPWGQAALYHHWSSVLPFTVFLLFTGYGFVQPEGTPGRPAGEGVYTCFPETTTVQPHGKHSPGKTGDQEQGVSPSPGQRHTEHAVVVLAKPTRGADIPGLYLFLISFSAEVPGVGRSRLCRTSSGCPPTQSLWPISSRFLLTGSLQPWTLRH